MEARDRIVLALDVDSSEKALQLVDELKEHVGVYKIGMQLYNSAGPSIVQKVNELGGKVFVDLKFHDIPNTVGAAGRVMTRLGAFMFNVHAAGGKEMMMKASEEVKKEAGLLGVTPPKMLAVTVLTSISQQQLQEEMYVSDLSVGDLVKNWALMAKEAGMDGVVCSPQEIEVIKRSCGSDFLTVTPGIRPAWAATNDQKRFTTPSQAMAMGGDYMVIGRPITGAADPREAAIKIIKELEENK
ncbi:MAG: orotidine-5'-phosphate decarboxylase [Bacillota bacterium]|nr:orotidine-5'-phosphate decarboxylase [Bacillota bacterium]